MASDKPAAVYAFWNKETGAYRQDLPFAGPVDTICVVTEEELEDWERTGVSIVASMFELRNCEIVALTPRILKHGK